MDLVPLREGEDVMIPGSPLIAQCARRLEIGIDFEEQTAD